MQDAHFVEDQLGDGTLGPSDFQAFYALAVAPSELPQWRAMLLPLDSTAARPSFTAPREPKGWWLTPADFAGLEFFSPTSRTGRVHGWVGVHAATGRIFVFTLTT